jgi:uncharacterized membrane protein
MVKLAYIQHCRATVTCNVQEVRSHVTTHSCSRCSYLYLPARADFLRSESYMKHRIDQHALKYLVGFLVVFLVRLIPFRPPNIEPVMATMMPFAKRFGSFGGFVFASLSIVLYDGVTSGWGVWTLVTAVAYGLLGLGSAWFFKHRASTAGNYVQFAVAGTIFYDAVTGLTVGPLLWGQPFMVALVGQIPFTLYHLVGNITFAAVVSPALYRLVLENQKLSVSNAVHWVTAR